MTATVAGIHLGIDTHANRPSAATVPDGAQYSCSTHGLIYKATAGAWATWATLGSSGLTDPMSTRGDSMYRNASNVTDRLPLPAAGMSPASNGTDLVTTYHPEMRDFCASGATAVDFSAASTGTGVTLLGTAGWNAHGKWTTNGSINFLDVASAVGTGDFDYRARIMYCASGSTIGDSFGGFRVTDSSRTAGTMLGFSALPRFAGAAIPTLRGRTGNANSGAVVNYWPVGRTHIQRIRRTGTTYTYEVSFNEGASWIQIETGTSSLNIAKVGFFFDTNSATACELLIDWVRSF